MCKFYCRTLYNRQLIQSVQFARIPVEFVHFITYFIRYQNCVKVITRSMAAYIASIGFQYLRTFDVYAISEYNV